MAREIRLQELALSKVWVRELYTRFGEWLVEEHPRHRRLLAVLARHFAFFQALEVECDSLEEVTGDLLLRRFGVAGLRTHTLPMRYLGASSGIEIGDGEKVRYTELHRIRVTLKKTRSEPWGSLIERYDRWLESKKIAPRTRRSYLSAAAQFCRTESLDETGFCTPDQMRHFLRRRPGLRASLFKWNTFCEAASGPKARMPPTRQRRRRPRTVRDLAKLLSEIDAVGPDLAPIRTLQRVIAKAFGYSVSRFVSYEWSTDKQAGKVWLCRVGERLHVPGPLVPLVASWRRRMQGADG